MVSFSIFIIFMIKMILLTHAFSSDWLNDVLKNSYKEVDPYQVVTFTSDSIDLLRFKNKEYPTVAITSNGQRLLVSQFLQESIHKSLVIHFTTNLNESIKHSSMRWKNCQRFTSDRNTWWFWLVRIQHMTVLNAYFTTLGQRNF